MKSRHQHMAVFLHCVYYAIIRRPMIRKLCSSTVLFLANFKAIFYFAVHVCMLQFVFTITLRILLLLGKNKVEWQLVAIKARMF